MYDDEYYYDEYDDNYDEDLEMLAALDSMDNYDKEAVHSKGTGCLTTIICFVISTTIIAMTLAGIFK